MRTIGAIETDYRGARYRSRLEARWAAMFDLCGISYVYEPFDFGGYVPDFVLTGERPVVVEVRPCIMAHEYVAVATEMQARIGFEAVDTEGGDCGAKRYLCDSECRYDLLVLGATPLPPPRVGSMWDRVAGLLGEFQAEGHWLPDASPPPSPWAWNEGVWYDCKYAHGINHIGVGHGEQNYSARPCGHYDGGHIPEARRDQIEQAWSQAHLLTRWKPR